MSSAATKTEALTPLRRLALHSTTTCAAEATEYGKCILASYADVRKDMCKQEFERFGKCVRAAVRRSFPSLFVPQLSVRGVLIKLSSHR